MDSDYLLRDDGSFVIKNYNSKPPFSNFLPGVAGAWGVPIWVFYVNRAQGVISFGIKDKDHSITEFFPANNAYCFAGLVGFRTFLKIGDKINYEPFRVISDYEREEEMVVKSASFEIRKTNANLGLNFCVKYFTLPNTIVGALVRELSIKNISDKEVDLEVLDGLPKIIPFGLNHVLLKDLARTLEAWMRSYIYDNLAIFRLIVDPKDSSQTKYVDGATFNCSFYHDNGKKVSPYLIVDPGVIFAEDTSYSTPVNFFKKHFRPPLNQITFGKTPCTFSHFKWNLKPGQEKKFYSIFGSCFKSDLIKEFVHNLDENFLKEKAKENEDIIDEIKNHALCVSASGPLNHYIGCTYLDNVLRGGYPYSAKGGSAPGGKFNGKDIYYIFSRKHGDLERDYNKFKLLPSYFSEGESNYRDINQNRRMDLFFNPVIANKNIIYFLNFIKIDGYNPLVVKGERLFFGKKEASAILKEFSINDKKVLSLMLTGFHLGDFFELLKEEGIVIAKREELAKRLVDRALREPMATHGEGYWIDHWRYNLDLIESFLYFYPDKAGELFLSNDYCFWDDEYRVKERKRRYHLKDSKVYQWHSVEEVQAKRLLLGKRGRFANFLRDKKGNIYRTHLVEKILALILNKAASLDPQGIGIEMEADKPGWCDSLNGLPALFGSSLCETLELKRACLMLTEAIKRLQAKGIVKVKVAQEVFWFLNSLNNLLKAHLADNKKDKDFLWWDKSNSIKEKFRKQTFFCLAGKQKELNCQIIEKFLENLTAKLNLAIAKAKDKATGLYFAYFSYNLANYSVKNKYVVASRFVKRALPHFLEGAVHSLRVEGNGNLYQPLKESSLFDAKLKMYRLNASLSDEPLEIGRSRIFVPGWLENESIWLHMEYKYLLEVLKKGLYEEFFKDFYNCAVCFLEPRTYGRNILENSSFIVSSAYPDQSLWGKGFVARLSGVTVELLDIWIVMCLGKKPFSIDKDNNLCIKFSPILKADLFTQKQQTIAYNGKRVILEKNSFAFKLFSWILVVYHNPTRKDTFTNDARIEKIEVIEGGKKHTFNSNTIAAPLSYAVRDLKVERIDVYFEQMIHK